MSPPRESSTGSELWLAHLRGETGLVRADPTPAQWSALFEQAERHQLRGLTYRLLVDGPFAARAPADLLEPLRAAYLDTAVRNAVLFRQTRLLVSALGNRGIPVMLLKGLHLARFVYPEPALRNMADVDLMVPRDRLAEAEQILVDLGFGPLPRPDLDEFCSWSNHLAKLMKPDAPVVELHWGIERPTSPFRIDLEGLWARSQPATLEGVPVRLLSNEDLILHLVLHCSYHHEFDRSALKGLVDVHMVVCGHQQTINWATLAARANGWGASGFVYATFRVAAELLGTQVPSSLFVDLHHQPIDEEIVETALGYTLAPRTEVPDPYLDLAKSKRLRDRARILWQNTILPRAAMERIHGLRPGTPLVFWYYVVRLLDLVARRSRILVNVLRRSGEVPAALDRAGRQLRIRSWVEGRPSDPATKRP